MHSEMTEIRSGRLSSGAIEQIKGIIHRENAAEVEVLNPRDRLEDYFLRIVSEAQAEKLQTSGATLGTGVSDFLTARETEEEVREKVLEGLVGREAETGTGSARGEEPVIPVESVQAVDLVDHGVLDSLVEVKTEQVQPEEAGGKAAANKAEAEPRDAAELLMDKSVIESLMRKKDGSGPAAGEGEHE
ncbi:MAG: hypothetical protein BWY71_00905 [Planctomycetes bacterium ADurb.Bin412]|nr:MAG: hypothetical protein BWY71_00905 [Planctomycetes bacterium ADurb.Bin412]